MALELLVCTFPSLDQALRPGQAQGIGKDPSILIPRCLVVKDQLHRPASIRPSGAPLHRSDIFHHISLGPFRQAPSFSLPSPAGRGACTMRGTGLSPGRAFGRRFNPPFPRGETDYSMGFTGVSTRPQPSVRIVLKARRHRLFGAFPSLGLLAFRGFKSRNFFAPPHPKSDNIPAYRAGCGASWCEDCSEDCSASHSSSPREAPMNCT